MQPRADRHDSVLVDMALCEDVWNPVESRVRGLWVRILLFLMDRATAKQLPSVLRFVCSLNGASFHHSLEGKWLCPSDTKDVPIEELRSASWTDAMWLVDDAVMLEPAILSFFLHGNHMSKSKVSVAHRVHALRSDSSPIALQIGRVDGSSYEVIVRSAYCGQGGRPVGAVRISIHTHTKKKNEPPIDDARVQMFRPTCVCVVR